MRVVQRSVLSAFLLLSSPRLAMSQNVRISKDGRWTIATQGVGGLVLGDGTVVPRPNGVPGFNEISMDNENGFVFSLWTTARDLCSWNMNGDTLELISCQTDSWGVTPFCGLSCASGLCVISGGTVGYSVVEYDVNTGVITNTRVRLNIELPGVIGHPDVELVPSSDSSAIAALSTDFSATPRFGTMMVDLTSDTEVRRFGSVDSPGLSSSSTTNFHLVNAFYVDPSGDIYMYTANGGMTLQKVDDSTSTETITAPGDPSFSAITVAVDQSQGRLVFGGQRSGTNNENDVLIFDISNGNAASPVFVDLMEAESCGGQIDEIASVAASSGQIAVVGGSFRGPLFLVGYEATVGTVEKSTTCAPSPPTTAPPAAPPSGSQRHNAVLWFVLIVALCACSFS